MPKKSPVQQYVGSQTFPTKGAAEKFAKEQRAKKAKEGLNTRYEIDLVPNSGEFRVRVFMYAEDAKGNLI